MRRILQEMGHIQPRTPIQTDNSTAEGVINSWVRPRRTKSMDMRFEWLLDREQVNLKFIGDPVRQIWQIILQSIIHHHIIEICKENFWRALQNYYNCVLKIRTRKLVWWRQTAVFCHSFLQGCINICVLLQMLQLVTPENCQGKYLNSWDFQIIWKVAHQFSNNRITTTY